MPLYLEILPSGDVIDRGVHDEAPQGATGVIISADRVETLIEDLEYELLNAERYTISVTYETWDDAALEAGETDDRGYEIANATYSENGLKRVIREFGIAEDCGNYRDFCSIDDAIDFKTGERTRYTLHLHFVDDRHPTQDEVEHVSKLVRS